MKRVEYKAEHVLTVIDTPLVAWLEPMIPEIFSILRASILGGVA